MSDEKMDVIVLGAGIVGVSAAYAARQQGLSVVLVDRREPGSETSYGNAGIFSDSLPMIGCSMTPSSIHLLTRVCLRILSSGATFPRECLRTPLKLEFCDGRGFGALFGGNA